MGDQPSGLNQFITSVLNGFNAARNPHYYQQQQENERFRQSQAQQLKEHQDTVNFQTHQQKMEQSRIDAENAFRTQQQSNYEQTNATNETNAYNTGIHSGAIQNTPTPDPGFDVQQLVNQSTPDLQGQYNHPQEDPMQTLFGLPQSRTSVTQGPPQIPPGSNILGGHLVQPTPYDPHKNQVQFTPSTPEEVGALGEKPVWMDQDKAIQVLEKRNENAARLDAKKTGSANLEINRAQALADLSRNSDFNAPGMKDLNAIMTNRIRTAETQQGLESAQKDIGNYVTEHGQLSRNQKLSDEQVKRKMDFQTDTQLAYDRDSGIAESMWKAQQQTGQPISEMIRGMKSGQTVANITKYLMDKGYKLPEYLTPAANSALGNIATNRQLIQEARNMFTHELGPDGKPLALSNMPMSKMFDYFKYKYGMASDQSNLISKLMVVDKTTAGMLSKNTGSPTEKVLAELEQHTPNPKTDSAKQSYEKLNNMDHYLHVMAGNVRAHGNKWGASLRGETDDVATTPPTAKEDLIKGIPGIGGQK